MYNTQHTFQLSKEHKEKASELASKTVPDMSYTVRELLDRFTTGTVPNIMQTALNEDEQIEDAHNVDVDLVDVYLNREKNFKLKQQLKTEQRKAEEEQKSKTTQKLEAQRKEIEELKKKSEAEQITQINAKS